MAGRDGGGALALGVKDLNRQHAEHIMKDINIMANKEVVKVVAARGSKERPKVGAKGGLATSG